MPIYLKKRKIYLILKQPGRTVFLLSAIFLRLVIREKTQFFLSFRRKNNAMEAFLKEFGDYYGYPDGPKNIQEIRDTEFKRLDKGLFFIFSFFFCSLNYVFLDLIRARSLIFWAEISWISETKLLGWVSGGSSLESFEMN